MSIKGKHGAKADAPGLLLSFSPSALRVEHGTKVQTLLWRLVRQDADLLELEVWDEAGKRRPVDVLVEGSDALTVYVQDDDGNDDETLRLERVH